MRLLQITLVGFIFANFVDSTIYTTLTEETRPKWLELLENKEYLWVSNSNSSVCKHFDLRLIKRLLIKNLPVVLVTREHFDALVTRCHRNGTTLSASAGEQFAALLTNFQIYPGTQWCGRGNRASNFYDLGVEHPLEDACCRTHDFCPHSIEAGECKILRSGEELCNKTTLTISHCQCDHRFQQCLQRLNTTTGRIIQHLYFNFLGIKCFTATKGIRGKTPEAEAGLEMKLMRKFAQQVVDLTRAFAKRFKTNL